MFSWMISYNHLCKYSAGHTCYLFSWYLFSCCNVSWPAWPHCHNSMLSDFSNKIWSNVSLQISYDDILLRLLLTMGLHTSCFKLILELYVSISCTCSTCPAFHKYHAYYHHYVLQTFLGILKYLYWIFVEIYLYFHFLNELF